MRGSTRGARRRGHSDHAERSALRDIDGEVIGAIGILRDMRELDKARAYAESLIKNAPDPVFVSDLEGKILQANDAVSDLLGFREDEVVEQSVSRFISADETREFVAALSEVVAHGVSRNVPLHPRSASGEVISTTLNASALRDPTATSSARSASSATCGPTSRSSMTSRSRGASFTTRTRPRTSSWRRLVTSCARR